MKISRIFIKEFEQFQDFKLDFTDPETGFPVEQICFIGKNGTGKSKLLRLISWFIRVIIKNIDLERTPANLLNSPNAKVLFEIVEKGQTFFIYFFERKVQLFESEKATMPDDDLVKYIFENKAPKYTDDLGNGFIYKAGKDFIDRLQFKDDSKDLLIYSPAESITNNYVDLVDVPKTTVSEALNLSSNFPYYAQVSQNELDVFWKLLVFNLRKRAEERERYENLQENLNKTKAQLIEEFDKGNPQILHDLASLWNKILNKAGLYFDVEGANNPYQLTDNLKAYIKLKKSNIVIPYNNLSTGIRNYIFRVGHVFSLYFNREIDRGILLIDEPENSLFPDFLFDLTETYKQIVLDKRGINNTQMFFATHNPIIAAQFKPCERIVLDWNEDGTVLAHKGVTPEGDDPNDILKKDFGLHELMGPVGVSEWKHYLLLRRKLKEIQSVDEKLRIVTEINRIGQLYNFPA